MLGVVILLAFALRLFYAQTVSLFIDEFTTMWAAQRVLDAGFPIFPSGNFYSHGMLFTYIEAGFRFLGGNGVLAARLPSILISTLTVAVLYWIGLRLFNKQTAILATAWLAVDPSSIIWGGRARMYALLQLLVLLTVYVFYRSVTERNGFRERVAAMALAVAALFTQPEAALLLPALGLIMLARRGLRWSLRPLSWLPFAIPAGGLAGLYLLEKVGQPGLLETVQSSRPFFGLSAHVLRGGETLAPLFVTWWQLPITLLFLGGMFGLMIRGARRRPLPESLWALLTCYVVVVPILFALFFLVPRFWQRPRYVFMQWPYFYLAAAYVAWYTAGRRFRNAWQWNVLVVVWAVFMLLTGWSTAYAPVEGYDRAFAYVREYWQPGDAIASPVPPAAMLYLGQNDYFAIQREYRTYVMLHNGREVDRWTDAPLLTSSRELNAALQEHRRLWFVVDGWRFETRYGVEFAQMVLDEMSVVHQERGVITFLATGYKKLPTPAVTRRPDLNFAGELRLLTYDRSPASPQPGQPLDVTLHWQKLSPAERRYTVFVHLLDREGRMVSQVDERLFGGRYRPLFWPREAIVRDRHTVLVPPDLPSGRYRLVAGLYDGTPDRPVRVLNDKGQPVATEVTLDYLWVGPREQVTPQVGLSALFGTQIRLLGYDLTAKGGNRWSVSLYWQAVKPLTENYTVFVHLVGPDGQIWGQHDSPPGGGFFPTSFWLPGDEVKDEHDLDLRDGAPAGSYRLFVGLYRPDDGSRLSVQTGPGRVADRLALTGFFIGEERP
jgi:4-amino-4-deoxy-L-arabinose transferase-like glycosyltransferase